MAQTLELTLRGMAAGGDAVGFTGADAPPIFVPGGIPGERVRVALEEERSRWSRGRLVALLEASPDRVEPPCPYFGPPGSEDQPRCGGCRWQHIAYPRQLALKRQIVIDQVVRHGRLGASRAQSQTLAEALVEEVIALGDPAAPDETAVLDYGYRTQARFLLNETGRLCLPGWNQEPVPIEGCLIQHPQLATLFAAWEVDAETGRELARELHSVTLAVGAVDGQLENRGHGEAMGAVVLESPSGWAPELALDLPVNVLLEKGPPGAQEVELLVGDWTYPLAVGPGKVLTYPPVGERRLTWPHALATEALYAIGVGLLALQPFEHAIDVWAGIGAGSLVLAEAAATVIALDDDPLAAAALEANLAGLDNVSPRPGPVRSTLKELSHAGHRLNAALMTPPDVGDAVDVFGLLAELGVSRVTLLTDDLPGLARALGPIHEQGFALSTIQPLDIYPQQPRTALAVGFDLAT